MSIRENIAFSDKVTDQALEKAIATAELKDFIDQPAGKTGLRSFRNEAPRLSGGQKQRIMLARALAIEPRILLLDDFTARVDIADRAEDPGECAPKIIRGSRCCPSRKRSRAIEDYDQIILLMEGELIASGTHGQLMKTCPEYVQIYQSQRSTSHYEQAAV